MSIGVRRAGDSAGRKALFEALGRAPGDRLIALHDRRETDRAGFAAAAGLAVRTPETGRAAFREGRVRPLDRERARAVRDDRLEPHVLRAGGVRRPPAERSALPTGLPAPFLHADRVRFPVTGPSPILRVRGAARGGRSSPRSRRRRSAPRRRGCAHARASIGRPTSGWPNVCGARSTAVSATPIRRRRRGPLRRDDDREEALPRSERLHLGQAAAGALFRMAEPARQRALPACVLGGRQGAALGERRVQDRPHWPPATAEALRTSPLLDGFDDDGRGRLMAILCPDLARQTGSGLLSDHIRAIEAREDTAPDPATGLLRIRDWWRREHAAQRADYDAPIWPEAFRPSRPREAEAADDRPGWFTSVALGIFRSRRMLPPLMPRPRVRRSDEATRRPAAAAHGRSRLCPSADCRGSRQAAARMTAVQAGARICAAGVRRQRRNTAL